MDMSSTECVVLFKKMKLPRELWVMILRVKTKRAIRERLEKILEFPHEVPVDVRSHTFITKSHSWCVDVIGYSIHERYHREEVKRLWNLTGWEYEEFGSEYSFYFYYSSDK